MSDVSDFLLTGLINFGAPAFGLTLMLGGIGIPLPTTLLVVAAGAFSRQGILLGYLSAVYGVAGAVLGDIVCYGIGRFARSWVLHRFKNSSLWNNAQKTFNRRGALAIYLTRFLLTALATPTNLIAGSSGYSFIRFVVLTFAGEFTWVIGYGGLGYLFGSEWELISDMLSDFGGLMVGVVILVAGIVLALRFRSSRQNSLVHA